MYCCICVLTSREVLNHPCTFSGGIAHPGVSKVNELSMLRQANTQRERYAAHVM